HAAGVQRAFRYLEHFGDAGFGRVVAAIQADHATALFAVAAFPRAPDDVRVRGIGADVVEVVADFGIEVRIGIFRAIGVPGLGDLAIAVGIDDLRAPALRELFVMRFIPYAGVDLAEDRSQQLVE